MALKYIVPVVALAGLLAIACGLFLPTTGAAALPFFALGAALFALMSSMGDEIKRNRDPRPSGSTPIIRVLPCGVKLVALTGRRHQGKSTAANYLREKYGAYVVHAFNGGKVMAEAYFTYITKSPSLAARMVHGDLKDRPSEYLPGYASPREFMERFGKFMGVDMGTPWTLEMEITLAVRSGARLIVVESLVYEGDVVRNLGGVVVRMEREGYEPPAVASDETQAAIAVDTTIRADNPAEACDALANYLYCEGVLPRL